MITEEQIHGSVKRILAFYTYLTGPQIAYYIEALHEAFGKTADPKLFDRACIEVMKAMDADSKALPKPGEYRAHYQILQDANGGNRDKTYASPLDPEANQRVSTLLHGLVDKWDERFNSAYKIDGKKPPPKRDRK